MKETFDSVWGSVKDRFTNPFLGTFLFVWLVRNWSLVYGVFIFGKDSTMEYKLNYVREHFKDYNVVLEFLINTSLTILLLVIVYLILVGVQCLMRAYKLLITMVNAYFDKIPIESQAHYTLLKTSYKSLIEKYRILSEKHDMNVTELEALENNILEKERSINSLELSCKYIFENFLITYPYKIINESNKEDVRIYFNDVFRSVKKNLKDEDLAGIIVNALSELNTKDCNVLVYFEAQYLSYLSMSNSLNHEELIKFRKKYGLLDTKVANFSKEKLLEMDVLSMILNLSGLDPRDEVTDFGIIVYKKLFEY